MKLHTNNYLYDPLIGNFLSWFIAGLIMYAYINRYSSSPYLIIIGMTVGSIWTLWLHSYRESITIEIRKKRIDHPKRLTVRTAIILAISFLSHLLIIGTDSDMIIPSLACALYLGSIVWLLFDFMLNIHREREWDYISQSPNAAWTDRFFRTKKWLWIASKILIFFGAGYLYFRTLIH